MGIFSFLNRDQDLAEYIPAPVLFAALAGGCGLPVIPALVVLKERFQEIEGGESDAAADY